MTWLLDDPTALYLFLGVLGLILLVLWWRGRDRRFLYGVGGVLLVGVIVWALGNLANTDGRQIHTALDEMGEAVRRKDIDGLFRHMTDDFRVRRLDRKMFRELVHQKAMRENLATEVVIWNRELVEVNRARRTATVHFDVKLRGPSLNESLFGNCEAQFVLDKDGKWKLKTFEVYNPPPGPHEPMAIPGL
jgi:ketosteroid isomerase-like protein